MRYSTALFLLTLLVSAPASYAQSDVDTVVTAEGDTTYSVCFTFEEADAIADSLEMRDVWQRAFAREFLRVNNVANQAAQHAQQAADWHGKYDLSQDQLAHCQMDKANTAAELKQCRDRPKAGQFVLGFGTGTLLTLLVLSWTD